MNRTEKLVGNPGHRDVGDFELLFPQQVQQQVERAAEFLQLDYEAGWRAQGHRRRLGQYRGGGCGSGHDQEKIRRPVSSWYGAMSPTSQPSMAHPGASRS